MEWFIYIYGSLSGGSREGTLRARAPTLFLDHTEARRAEEDFFDTVPAAPLSPGLDDRPSPPPPHLRVWIRHCLFSWPRDRSVSRCMENSYFCHFKCAYIKYTDEWWRSRKRWKPPAESTMNHPFIPGGLSWKKVRGWPSGYYVKGNQSRCGANFINVYLLSLKVKEESFERAFGQKIAFYLWCFCRLISW